MEHAACVADVGLAPDVRERQERRNEVLRWALANPAEHIAEIGKLLKESQTDLPQGVFLPWLENMFPRASPMRAYDYMMVSEVLADFPHVTSISPQTLFALARISTPEELRHHVIKRAPREELVRH